MSAKTLIEGYVEAEQPASLAAMHKKVALYLSDAAETNGGKLNRLYVIFQWALVALTVETGALLFALWRSAQ
jgi:hypothetical protein